MKSVVAVLLALASAQNPATGHLGVSATLESAASRKDAPNFSLLDSKAKPVHLTDFRGKVVLLDFWATHCGGCVEEIPIFIELVKSYGRMGLSAVGVSEDIPYSTLSGPTEAWAQVNPFVRDHHVNYPVVMGDQSVLAAFDIQALPLTYLIDRKGRIAAVYPTIVNRVNLEANIKKLLAE